MGVFEDKKFEGLDWISQATEPIDSECNNILTNLPDEVKIDFSTYIAILQHGYNGDINVLKCLKHLNPEITSVQMPLLHECFTLDMCNETNLIIDFNNKTISGDIFLRKISQTIDEDVLKRSLGIDGLNQVLWHVGASDDLKARMNEVLEILGKCEDGLRTRSMHKKKNALVKRLSQVFKTNEWNIRDTELANKVGAWVKDYINDGNLAAIRDLCRLKVMTHKGQPIYSMENIE